MAQLRQFPRIPLSSGDGTQDGHSRHSIDVGNRPMEAHVHLVQALLHSPQPVRTLRHQVRLITHQRAQYADRCFRPERTPQQAATVQPLDPLAIGRVRFSCPVPAPPPVVGYPPAAPADLALPAPRAEQSNTRPCFPSPPTRPAVLAAIPPCVTVLRSLPQSWLLPDRFDLGLARTPSAARSPNRFPPRSLE